jgi:hypothetical protein
MPHNSLYRYKAGPVPQLEAHPPSGGHIDTIREVPEGTKITMTSAAFNTPAIRTEILLFRKEKKIEFSYSITKNKVIAKEAVYFAFPFRANAPKFSYSLQTAWVDPAKDQLPGANKEWFTATDWAAVHDSDFSAAVIPLDVPLVTFGDIVRGKWPTEFATANGSIFSWVMNNYWGTNFVPWQGGNFEVRYVITSQRSFDPDWLSRFGREEMTPLEVSPIAGTLVPAHAPKSAASFLSIDNPSLVGVTWKIAEDGNGTILRLQNISSRTGTAQIRSEVFRVSAASKCNLLEECTPSIPIKQGGFAVSFGPYEVLSIRLNTESTKQGGAAPLAAR